MTAPGAAAPPTAAPSPAAALLRVARGRRPPVPPGERCEMCAEPVGPAHPHLVNVESRALLCACRPCHLLFADDRAQQRFRAVPDRYLRFDGPGPDARTWQELRIPVGLAFLFRNSALERTVALYPGPAGATESELPPDAWDALLATHPAPAVLRPDVEALLLRRPGPGAGAGSVGSCHLVPIDACYELAGRLRTLWRGFDGGAEAREAVDAFFARVHERSRPAPAPAPAAAVAAAGAAAAPARDGAS